jgi:S-adenosylmethionine/arginine decarboxylase-like enzyme
MTSWGYHLMLNAAKCRPSTIRCAYTIRDFSHRLVKDIDMIPYGQPQIVMFGSGNKKGYTLVQLIETSNICAHFVEETDDIYLDVFSCKTFDPKVVQRIVDEVFEPTKMDSRLVVRDAYRRME